MSKLSQMQGTSAFLEYLKPKEEHRRSKKKCISYKAGTCMSKTARFMTKCTSPTFCNQYKEEVENSNFDSESNLKRVNGDENKTISLYSNVKIKDYSIDEILEIIIVPKNESDFINNKISVESELGMALLGKKEGNTVRIRFKGRKRQEYYKYKVLEIK